MRMHVFKSFSLIVTAMLIHVACGRADEQSAEPSAMICREGDCAGPVGPVVKRAPNLKVKVVSSNCSTQKAVFEVSNTGLLPAPATVARATFDGGYPRDFAIPALAVGAKHQVSTDLYFPGGDLTAVFKADVNNSVTEQSETDNSTSLFCLG